VTVRDDPQNRPLPPPPFEHDEPVAQIAPRRKVRRPGFGRAMKRALLGGIAAAALLGGGIAAFRYGQKPLKDAWNAVRRHGASENWSVVQRRAANAWVAIRREIPIDGLRAEGSASPDPSPGAQVAGTAKSRRTRKGSRATARTKR
jgi:hypothetical protein